jgi:glycosyltransferase involved in cell wall biosynthesis
MTGIDIIAITYGHTDILKCFINSIKSQTNKNWTLHIVHDGPNVELGKNLIDEGYVKDQVKFYQSKERAGNYGHNLRKWALDNLVTRDFVLITNADNYYVPVMVDEVLQNKDTDFIYFDCVHNYPHFHNKSSYGYLKAELKICFIDMGCVVVRSILAKKVGFNHVHHTADWKYFEEILAQQPNIKRIDKILFVHN